MVAQNCGDTSRGRAGNGVKSWAIQDSSHALKACAAATIHWVNVDMASSYVMYYFDTSNACSGAR